MRIMVMTVVDVRVVRVPMPHFPMGMRVAVSFFTMPVLVVFIVHVSVVVRQRLVPMRVSMPLSQMQPDAHSHKRRGTEKREGQALAQNQNGKGCPDKRGHREIGACPGCAEAP